MERYGRRVVLVRLIGASLAVALLAGMPVSDLAGERAGEAELAAGDAALRRFSLSDALVAYRAAVAAAPDDYEANWKLARALTDEATLETERSEQERLCVEAAKLARKAVALRPSDPKGHDYLAIAVGKLALFEGGQRKIDLSKEVKVEAERALRLDANDDLALHVLAIWNRELAELSWFLRQAARILYGKLPEGSLDDAIAGLTRASQLRPEVIPHHVELGITLADASRWAEARRELEKGLELPTGWVTDDYYRGLARRQLVRVDAHLR